MFLCSLFGVRYYLIFKNRTLFENKVNDKIQYFEQLMHYEQINLEMFTYDEQVLNAVRIFSSTRNAHELYVSLDDLIPSFGISAVWFFSSDFNLLYHQCPLHKVGIKKCGLNKKANNLLFNAVPMHDVGKLGIADSILQKPGPLSCSEFEIIKTHCRVGSNILSGGKSTLLKVAQSIALNHHERWDGSGYPQGLTKKKIPLTSRITSICDVFDALTSPRPYKKAWSREKAQGSGHDH